MSKKPSTPPAPPPAKGEAPGAAQDAAPVASSAPGGDTAAPDASVGPAAGSDGPPASSDQPPSPVAPPAEGFTRLRAPPGVVSVSHEGESYEVADGTVDVPHAAISELIASHGFES